MVEVSTSILSVDKENSIKTFYNLETAGTDYFHIDVMDGKFVEKNTEEIMLEYSKYIKSISNIPLDVHLMVENVEEFIEKYSVFEPNIITFHLESLEKEKVNKVIDLIKQNHSKVGISVKPNTSISEIYEFLPYIHTVLVMTVEPGKGGQQLIEGTIKKVEELKKYIDENKLEVDIEVDGGINPNNVGVLRKAGANIIVAGSSIINSDDYAEKIELLKRN